MQEIVLMSGLSNVIAPDTMGMNIIAVYLFLVGC